MAIACTDLQELNRSALVDQLDRARLAKRTINVMGAVGISKSQTVKWYAHQGNHWFVHVHWGKLAIHSAGGIAFVHEGEVNFSKPSHIKMIEEATRLAQAANDDTNNDWSWSGEIVVLYDEVWNAAKEVTSVALEMFDERRIESYQIPDNVQMICAGNRLKDGAHAFNMSSTAPNRMANVCYAGPTAEEWVEWGSASSRIDPIILGYIENNATKLHVFEGTACLNATPRSYEIASDMFRAKPVVNSGEFISVIHSCLPREIAADMLVYYKLGKLVTPWQEIVDSPETAPLPSEIDASNLTDEDGRAVDMGAGGNSIAAMFFTLRMINENIADDRDEAKAACTFVKRLDPEYQAAMMAMIMKSMSEGRIKRSIVALFRNAVGQNFVDVVDAAQATS